MASGMAGRIVGGSTNGRAMATKNESAEIGTVKPKCGKRIYPPGRYYGVPCGKTATYEEAGAHYCKTHHPPTRAAKRAVMNAKWDARFEASHAKSKAAAAELAAMRKDAARHRWLEAQCVAGALTVASVSEFGIDPWSGDDLTGKIDAAMAKTAA